MADRLYLMGPFLLLLVDQKSTSAVDWYLKVKDPKIYRTMSV